jgi:hypothetical protein
VDAEEFVEAFAEGVFRTAVRGTQAGLEAPPGRSPAADLVQASAWYRALSDDHRAVVGWVIAATAHAATFGALAVIDGVRQTGPLRYELVAIDADGARSLVNPETSEDLHDIFQGLVMLPDGRLLT